MKRSLTATVLVGLAGAAVLVAPGSAFASSGHSINGTCYENGNTFVSSNVRTMAGTTISAGNWTAIPTHGMLFGASNYNTGGNIGQIYAPPTGQQRLGTAGNGTQFVNYFRLQSSGKQDNYSFTGSEVY